MFQLDPAPKIITFDCYGTLVQYHEVLLSRIGELLRSKGSEETGKAAEILDNFSRHSRRLEVEKPHRLYKDVLRTGFRRALHEHHLSPTDDEIETLASCIVTIGPHPEVPGVLRQLRTLYKLAIFTNSDEDLIVHNVEKIGVPFDYVITAERAQAYKPSKAIFDYGYRAMGVTKEKTVHVAMGMFLDMKACHDFGIRGIWINRRGERGNPAWLPYEELPDLSGLPSLLLA